MAVVSYMFQMIRNRILHGPRKELHVVAYQVDTDKPEVISNVSTSFVQEVEDDPKWDYNNRGPRQPK